MPQGDAFPFVRMWSAPPHLDRCLELQPGQVGIGPGEDRARWGLGQAASPQAHLLWGERGPGSMDLLSSRSLSFCHLALWNAESYMALVP